MLTVHPIVAVAIPLLALLAGTILGGCLGASSEADAWSNGYTAGRRETQEQRGLLGNLPDPRFVGDE